MLKLTCSVVDWIVVFLLWPFSLCTGYPILLQKSYLSRFSDIPILSLEKTLTVLRRKITGAVLAIRVMWFVTMPCAQSSFPTSPRTFFLGLVSVSEDDLFIYNCFVRSSVGVSREGGKIGVSYAHRNNPVFLCVRFGFATDVRWGYLHW